MWVLAGLTKMVKLVVSRLGWAWVRWVRLPVLVLILLRLQKTYAMLRCGSLKVVVVVSTIVILFPTL